MGRLEDEQAYDSRNPPWLAEDDVGVFPEAQLLDDQAGFQEMLEAPEAPEFTQERSPQVAPRPEGDAGGQVAAESVPAPRRTGRQRRMEQRNETNRAKRDSREVQERITAPGGFGAPEVAWRPPIFDQFQEVNAIDLGVEDEVQLAEPRDIAREDPTVAMNETVGLAEAAYQNAEVAAEQAAYLHNTMSRLRDTEVGFMTKNYV